MNNVFNFILNSLNKITEKIWLTLIQFINFLSQNSLIKFILIKTSFLEEKEQIIEIFNGKAFLIINHYGISIQTNYKNKEVINNIRKHINNIN